MVRTASFILLVGLIGGCSSKPRIVVGSKNFTEQVLLGEILAQHIEKRTGTEVTRKLNLGGTLLAHEALKSGGIDLYPEYTGTALTAVLKQNVDRDPKSVMTKVRAGYKEWGLSWLNSLGFDNTFAMVVRTDIAKSQNLTNLSEAARRSQPWKMGVGYEFIKRPDGLAGLVEAYGMRLNGDPMTMDLGLLYRALEAGTVEMAAANATDGMLSRSEFTVLADDRNYFPPYECAVIVRDSTLLQFPQLRPVLEELSSWLSERDMRRMNAAIDIQHRGVAEVAREFLGRGGGKERQRQ